MVTHIEINGIVVPIYESAYDFASRNANYFDYGYFCTKPRKGILRNEKYIISNIFNPFSGS
jgi:hypothetical protein